MVSSRGISLKSESTSRLPMKSLLSEYTISSAKANKSLTVNSLNVTEESLGTKKFCKFVTRSSNCRNYRSKWWTNMNNGFIYFTMSI